MTLPTAPSPITSEFLIVGEGSGDASFIAHLCQVRGVTGFQIEDARGESRFVDHIKGLQSRRGYDRLKAMLVVGDNDDGPEDSFGRIRNYLKDAKVPYPDATLTVARRDREGLAVVVMMIPYEAGIPVRGCLETLLLRSLDDGQPRVKACVDGYRDCLGGARTRNQEDKLRLRCFVAAMHPEDPNLSLSFVVSPSKGIIDLNHRSFDEIYRFLAGFSNFCEPRQRGRD